MLIVEEEELKNEPRNMLIVEEEPTNDSKNYDKEWTK